MSKRLSDIERELKIIEMAIERYSEHGMFKQIRDAIEEEHELIKEKESILQEMSTARNVITVEDFCDLVDLVDILLGVGYKLNIDTEMCGDEIMNYTIKFKN